MCMRCVRVLCEGDVQLGAGRPFACRAGVEPLPASTPDPHSRAGAPLPPVPCRRFVVLLLDKLSRLSYWDRIHGVVPPEFQVLLPAKPEPTHAESGAEPAFKELVAKVCGHSGLGGEWGVGGLARLGGRPRRRGPPGTPRNAAPATHPREDPGQDQRRGHGRVAGRADGAGGTGRARRGFAPGHPGGGVQVLHPHAHAAGALRGAPQRSGQSSRQTGAARRRDVCVRSGARPRAARRL